MPKEDYKPNSHKYNDDVHASEKVEPEHKPRVHERISLGQRFKNAFMPSSLSDIVVRLVTDEVIPRLLDVIEKTLHSFVDAFFDRGGNRDSDRYNTSKTRYGRYYDDGDNYVKVRHHKKFSTDNFAFESRRDAEHVLNQLIEHCKHYDGTCSVSYFLDCVDYERPYDWTYSDVGWSWDALDRARIYANRDGTYRLSIPEPDTRY